MDAQDARALIARNVKRLRVEQQLTQEELAFRAGLMAPAVSRIERAVADPRASTIAKLAQGLGVPPARLWDEA
jgi:transcriptional regulator with XRE-family HTH domain